MTVNDKTMDRRRERFGGVLLALTGLLTLVLVMHHPVLRAHHGIGEMATGIRALAAMDRIVHGALMFILGVQALGFYIFSARIGFRHPAVVAGFIAFAVGVVVMIVPTTLDGFVTPDVAQACLATPGGCTAADASVFRLVAAMIQDFTKVALLATALGAGCWSLALLLRRGLANRLAGSAGLLCAGIPASILLFSDLHLRPDNLAQIIAAQAVWCLIAAGLLIVGGAGAKAMSTFP